MGVFPGDETQGIVESDSLPTSVLIYVTSHAYTKYAGGVFREAVVWR
jgi:hypothetical protein